MCKHFYDPSYFLPSVRNGVPGKEGLFIISVTSGSLADKTGVRVSLKLVND